MEARPSYLPWLDPGEEVPEPRRYFRHGTAYVAWTTGESDPSRQRSVVFRRNSEPQGGLGERIPVRLEGADGYYYGGPGGPSVLWDTGVGPCNLVTLTLSLPGAGPGELREELMRVVESLES